MLLNLREYHRPLAADQPAGLRQALDLLARAEIHTAVLAGGDTLIGSGDPTVHAVVDLQALDALRHITTDSHARYWDIGALVTRTELAEHAAEPAIWPTLPLAADGARRWGGQTQRNRATIGGAIATAAPNDPLLVALLACQAEITIESVTGPRRLPLTEFFSARNALLAQPGLITAVHLPRSVGITPRYDARFTWAAVARTPSDAPIVVACALLATDQGVCAALHLALGGVAETPIHVPEVGRLLIGKALTPGLLAEAGDCVAALAHPAGDFRGSAEYRRAMAGVLAKRALKQAWERHA